MAEEQSSSPVPRTRKWRGSTATGATGTPAVSPSKKRARKIFTLLAVMLALAGAAVALLVLIQPFHEPVFLTIPVTEYKAPHFVPNALALQDSNALLEHFAEHKQAFDNQERDALVQRIQSLKQWQPQQPLVFHLTAHARTDGADVYLLPANADPDDRGTWLPVREVLRHLQQAVPSRNKFLILDIMRPSADPRLGVLANDVAERLQPILEEITAQDPRLWVLCACSPGQVSLVCEDLGESVFGYYLVEGLNGFANGFNPKQRQDGNVSVKELAEFVRARVDRWAAQNRHSRQTPVLYAGANAGDFDLVALPEHKGNHRQNAADGMGPYPDWLQDAWKRRDQARDQRAFRSAPHAFRRLEANLLRAEQRWRGGVEATRIHNDLDRDFADYLQAVTAKNVPKPHSLALARSRGMTVDPAVGAALRALLAKWDGVVPPKPEELEPLKQELAKLKAPFAPLAWTAFEAIAADSQLRPQKIALVKELLPSSPQYVETLFLQRLAELKLEHPKQWPGEVVHHALQAVHEEEKAVAAVAVEPRALPWVRDVVKTAADSRHEGEKLLFKGDAGSVEKARSAFEEAAKQSSQINDCLETVQKAYWSLDEALSFLPAYLPYLLNQTRTGSGADEENMFQAAVDAALALDKLLVELPATPFPSLDALQEKVYSLKQRTATLRAGLRKLRRPFDEENVSRLLAAGQGSIGEVDAILEIEAILETPCTGAAHRLKLWQQRQELSQRLHQQTQERDRADDTASDWKPTPALASPDSKAAGQRERQRATRRASLAIALLRLGEAAGTQDLGKDLASAAVDWHPLGQKLRNAWAVRLPEQLQQLMKKGELKAADKLSRVLGPFDSSVNDILRNPKRDPTLQLRLQETKALWHWLEERCRSESRSYAGRPGYGDFYNQAAEEYARSTR